MWPLLALCCLGGLALALPQSPRVPTFASPALAAPPAVGAAAVGAAAAAALPDTTGSRVERLGRAFKRQVRRLRARSGRLELVFLVDESSSVGPANFASELRFVKKLLSDFPVVPAATRVAIVTFSSRSNVAPRVDYISRRRPQQHKCALLGREIPGIAYRGGGTYTKGAFQQAAQILRHARGNSTKVIFLITDGYSNGGDPRPIAASLREFGVEIFTFGIWQGNTRELNDMASHPKEDHCYLLHSFTEFEALARRALHEDLPSGSYIQEDISHCSYLCEANENCCDIMASCKCGTHTGQFECICEKGYYGKGLQHECTDFDINKVFRGIFTQKVVEMFLPLSSLHLSTTIIREESWWKEEMGWLFCCLSCSGLPRWLCVSVESYLAGSSTHFTTNSREEILCLCLLQLCFCLLPIAHIVCSFSHALVPLQQRQLAARTVCCKKLHDKKG